MKFVVGQGGEVLSTMAKQTDASTQDLGALIQRLGEASEPVARSFQGRARVLFDQFHAHATDDGRQVNQLLASIAQGVGGMDSAYFDFDEQAADTTQQISGCAPYNSGSFA